MKIFETIDYYGDYWGIPGIAFDKLDGCNIRFEYSKKRGFYKFGSRNVLIDESHDLGPAIKIFRDKYEARLDKVFCSKDYRDIQSFVCFGEFISKTSAFGRTSGKDENLDVVLFDIDMHNKGFIPPRTFVKEFGHLGIPSVIYEGNLNREFVKDIKDNKYGLQEGVIFKGVVNAKKGQNPLYYCKIKTNDWFDRLRGFDTLAYDLEMKQVKEK